MDHMFSFKFLCGITLPIIMGITCMIFSCVYFGKAHLYIIMIMIMQVRKYPCQHSAGQVLVNGMPSGALTWMLRWMHVNAFLASHILLIFAHNIIYWNEQLRQKICISHHALVCGSVVFSKFFLICRQDWCNIWKDHPKKPGIMWTKGNWLRWMPGTG